MKLTKFAAKCQAGVLALMLVASVSPFSVGATVLPVENPSLSGSCGLDIALVMDTSGSIGGNASTGELDDMQTALQGFASALSSTPSVFSLVSFDDSSTLEEPFMADAATVSAAIEATDGNGATNWEAGLTTAAAQFDPRAGKANLIIFASDGNPTTYIGDVSDSGGSTSATDLSKAVAVADLIKAGTNTGSSPTRIITVGIGGDVSQANLEAISSADAYYSAENFASLGDTLDDIATELCGGTLNVSKVIDADGNLETTEDRTAAEGWSFTVNDAPYQTDGTGSFSLEADAGAYAVTEIPQPETYTFLAAECTEGTLNPETLTVSGITVDDQEIVSCTFINTPVKVPDNSATVYADKVVCAAEQYLPNWGDGDNEITIGATTAADYVSDINAEYDSQVCWLEDWTFEWAPSQTENPGDNLVGPAEGSWTTFGDFVTLPNPDGGKFWFREVLPDSGWLDFSGWLSGNEEDPLGEDDEYSAEFYCGSDVKHYDNYDFLLDVDAEETFYCVGFNVDETPVDQCEYGYHFDEELSECVPDELPICSNGLDDDNDGLDDADDPGCWENPEDSGTYNPEDGSEENGNDVCPNIEGVQEELPEGMSFSNSGNCDGDGSSNRSGNSRGGGGGGGGEVLGAAACGPLLTQYLHKDWANDASEVTKLQEFLNSHMLANLTVTGAFGPETFEWVKAFQIKYGDGVLNPWVGFPASGITGPTTPTGFVYQTTRWQINNIWCPGSEAFPETLI